MATFRNINNPSFLDSSLSAVPLLEVVGKASESLFLVRVILVHPWKLSLESCKLWLLEYVTFSSQILKVIFHPSVPGIAHRDLKPENILCAHENQVWKSRSIITTTKTCTISMFINHNTAVVLAFVEMHTPYASAWEIGVQRFQSAYQQKEIEKWMTYFKSTFTTGFT